MNFDPFNDRRARDIRNELSKQFCSALAAGDLAPLQARGRALLVDPTASAYADYVTDRMARYEKTGRSILGNALSSFHQALVLWDHELFFEVHELLEELWMKAVGDEKKALQAMIRAAGGYVHLASGRKKSAGLRPV